MDLVLAAIRRHPVIFVFCLLASIGGGAGVWYTVPVKYETRATFAILPPNTMPGAGGKSVPINSWQQAGGISAQIAVGALTAISASASFRRNLVSRGVTSEATVIPDGVVLTTSAINVDPDATVADTDVLVTSLRDALRQQQAAVQAPAGTYLDMHDITGVGEPVALTASKVKLTGVAGALGLLLTLVLVVAADRRRPPRGPAAEHMAALAGRPGKGVVAAVPAPAPAQQPGPPELRTPRPGVGSG